MRYYLTGDEKVLGQSLHDKIKNHDFRKKPEKYLFEEYCDLIYEMYSIVCSYNKKDNFHMVERRKCKVPWSSEPQMIAIDLWTNPNVALLDELIHPYKGIKWRLSSKFTSGEDASLLISKFIEITELMLMIFHKLLDGLEVSEVKYPTDNNTEGSHTYVCFVKNPLFDGLFTDGLLERSLWTKTQFLNKKLYIE